ncbi:MAG: ABC transporter ATP-binding protein [Maritimibacter sp.]
MKIELRHISKSFQGRAVLRDVSLTLESGARVALIGRSGTGKSVLLRIALGLVAPDAGEVWVDGAKMNARRHRKMMNDSGIALQSGSLLASQAVWENVMFSARHALPPMSRRSAIAAARDLMVAVGLPPNTARLMPSDLSGGMAKRAGLARILAAPRRLIAFDEPTSGLDPVSASDIGVLLADIAGRDAATTLTVTHDLNLARAVADTVVLLEDGQIRWRGAPDDMAETKDSLVRAFLKSAQMFPADVSLRGTKAPLSPDCR